MAEALEAECSCVEEQSQEACEVWSRLIGQVETRR